MSNIPAVESVMKACPVDNSPSPAYAPVDLDAVVQTIRRERPRVVFAPHVETSSGIMLPESWIKGIAAAVHEVGGLFVLDCIASGCIWIDMAATGVDVLISAPQKGWSSTPCAGIVMLSALARERLAETVSTCFAVDLKRWVAVMEAYEKGGHMYHTTMPTDSIIQFRNVQQETALWLRACATGAASTWDGGATHACGPWFQERCSGWLSCTRRCGLVHQRCCHEDGSKVRCPGCADRCWCSLDG